MSSNVVLAAAFRDTTRAAVDWTAGLAQSLRVMRIALARADVTRGPRSAPTDSGERRRHSHRHAIVSTAAMTRLGTRIGDGLRLDRWLGAGGMGSVFAATRERDGARLAVKILHGHLRDQPAARASFASEREAADAVCHPGVVRVFDAGETDDGAPFLVMELLEGETLAALFEREPSLFDEHTVARILDRLLGVLGAVHAAGLVHCDVKPENVFLCSDGRLKLLDFGIASRDGSASRDSLQGTISGTPGFMAPEQARGDVSEIDPRSDLWAVGAIAFFLFCGRHVHEGSGALQVILAASTDASSLALANPGVSPSFARLVDRGLATRKADRWQDALAMQLALAAALGEDLSCPATRTWPEPGVASRPAPTLPCIVAPGGRASKRSGTKAATASARTLRQRGPEGTLLSCL